MTHAHIDNTSIVFSIAITNYLQVIYSNHRGTFHDIFFNMNWYGNSTSKRVLQKCKAVGLLGK